jgi:hypothetical protein
MTGLRSECDKVGVLDGGNPRLLLRLVLLAVESSLLFRLLGLASWTSRGCPVKVVGAVTEEGSARA